MHHDIVKLYKPVTKVWMVRQRTWLNNLLVNVARRGHAAIVDLLIQNGANRQGASIGPCGTPVKANTVRSQRYLCGTVHTCVTLSTGTTLPGMDAGTLGWVDVVPRQASENRLTPMAMSSGPTAEPFFRGASPTSCNQNNYVRI
jgi:hypothetical protein